MTHWQWGSLNKPKIYSKHKFSKWATFWKIRRPNLLVVRVGNNSLQSSLHGNGITRQCIILFLMLIVPPALSTNYCSIQNIGSFSGPPVTWGDYHNVNIQQRVDDILIKVLQMQLGQILRSKVNGCFCCVHQPWRPYPYDCEWVFLEYPSMYNFVILVFWRIDLFRRREKPHELSVWVNHAWLRTLSFELHTHLAYNSTLILM